MTLLRNDALGATRACTFADVRASEPFRLTINAAALAWIAADKQSADNPGPGVHIFETGFARNGIAMYPVSTEYGQRDALNLLFLGASGLAWQITLVVSPTFHPTQASMVRVVTRLRHSQAW